MRKNYDKLGGEMAGTIVLIVGAIIFTFIFVFVIKIGRAHV